MISGLTCAGKTTHAHLLADSLGYDYISASSMLARHAGVPHGKSLWRTNEPEIQALRSDDEADRAVDKALVQRAADGPPAVFDSWTLPYLYQAERPLVKVRLDSTLRARAIRFRLAVSRSKAPLDQEQAEVAVRLKDEAISERLRRLYNFELLEPRDDLVDLPIDTSRLVSAPTIKAAATGIAIAHRLVLAEIENYVDLLLDGESASTRRQEDLAGCVVLNETGRLLLLHRRTEERTQWELPGGHVRDGETPARAAERKLKDEAGLDVVVVSRLGATTFDEGDVTFRYTWFLGRMQHGSAQLRSDIFDGLRYFSLDELELMSKQGELSVNGESLVAAISSGEVDLGRTVGT